jgi:hypothetical protein
MTSQEHSSEWYELPTAEVGRFYSGGGYYPALELGPNDLRCARGRVAQKRLILELSFCSIDVSGFRDLG